MHYRGEPCIIIKMSMKISISELICESRNIDGTGDLVTVRTVCDLEITGASRYGFCCECDQTALNSDRDTVYVILGAVSYRL